MSLRNVKNVEKRRRNVEKRLDKMRFSVVNDREPVLK